MNGDPRVHVPPGADHPRAGLRARRSAKGHRVASREVAMPPISVEYSRSLNAVCEGCLRRRSGGHCSAVTTSNDSSVRPHPCCQQLTTRQRARLSGFDRLCSGSDTITDAVLIRNPLISSPATARLRATPLTTLTGPSACPAGSQPAGTFLPGEREGSPSHRRCLRAEAAQDSTTGTSPSSSASRRCAATTRRMWAPRSPQYRSGIQYFHHDLVGDLDLNYESFDPPKTSPRR
jgi:hypothetical protein